MKEDEFIDLPGGMKGRILHLSCCRDWPILMGVPWGRCGYCGDKPRRRD